VESDEGDEMAAAAYCNVSRQNQRKARFEQVFWRAEKNTRVILRSQTPLSYPSQNKTVQSDVTLIHSENLR
jgi:hypothetical protein